MEIVTRKISDIHPYKLNAKKHDKKQIENVANSIQRFGWQQPLVIDKEGTIVIGHCRYEAARMLKLKEVPVTVADTLTPEEVKELRIADNKLNESEWDIPTLMADMKDITFDGFDLDFSAEASEFLNIKKNQERGEEFFNREDRNDTEQEEGNDEYNEFLEKFKLAKTTDDCYTPEKVYDAIVEWVEKEYNVSRENFVRPFYPGGDYQKYAYTPNSIVVDNPPFSILAEILRWYTEHGVKFFLFAPSLTLFSSSSSSSCAIGAGANIVYENGANVSTSFLTNLEMEYRFRTAPTLYQAVKKAVEEVLSESKKELPKNNYPNQVVLATMLSRYSKYGVDFKVRREESERISQLDDQKESGKALYGSGYLISERAAAERAAAERAAAERAAANSWTLSDREKEIVKQLSRAAF